MPEETDSKVMKTPSLLTFVVLIGTVVLVIENAPAATKKKATDKVPAPTVDPNPPVTTNETWTPKTNRQPVPTPTPANSKTPTTNKTPAPNKNVTPQKPVVLGDKLKNNILSNPQPKLPAEAKTKGVSGPVRVEVTVDEKGNVLSAKAVSGDPLLRKAAEQSATKARFTPTKLKGQPVKVTGVIQYNFVLQ